MNHLKEVIFPVNKIIGVILLDKDIKSMIIFTCLRYFQILEKFVEMVAKLCDKRFTYLHIESFS